MCPYQAPHNTFTFDLFYLVKVRLVIGMFFFFFSGCSRNKKSSELNVLFFVNEQEPKEVFKINEKYIN